MLQTLRSAALMRFGLALALTVSVAAPLAAQSPTTPVFRSFEFVGLSNGDDPGFRGGTGDFTGYIADPTPSNTVMNFDKSFSNGSRLHGQAAANYRGFWSSGTRVEAWIDRAQYPTVTPPSLDPPFGYYVVGGIGSWTRHRFITPQSLTDAFGQFNWHVTGDLQTNLGRIDARLDFGVGRNATSFDDTYNSAVVPNLMTKFGPGQYSYTTGVELNTVLDFMFWSSSFWQIDPDQLAALGSQTRDLYGLSEFMRTFNMDSIQLFDAAGNPITDWSLIDEDTGQTIWNQNGRVTAAVPEPGAVALLGAILLAGGLLRRRRAVK